VTIPSSTWRQWCARAAALLLATMAIRTSSMPMTYRLPSLPLLIRSSSAATARAAASMHDCAITSGCTDVFREHARRWLYTAITRAADRLTLVQGAEYEDEDD